MLSVELLSGRSWKPVRYAAAGGPNQVVLLHHLTAVLDDWDPRTIDSLAKKHHVIVFNNRGVGGSKGATPDTIDAMAADAVVGRLDLVEFAKASNQAGTFAELKEVIDRNPGKTGLMLFIELDHGAVLRKETGRTTPKIVRLVIGNPLVMKEMAKHVPEAGSYAPATVLVDERGDFVYLSYDRMASLLAPYGNMDAIAVARDLDSKIQNLLQSVI